MSRVYRSVFIVWIVFRYGLDELVLTSFKKPWLRVIARVVSIGRDLSAPRGQRLREALERLGPIFVKFGQVLSTRRDLLPVDIADELARLQDRVPPFDSEVAVATIERAFRKPVADIFVSFERVPEASASIAQVHFAVLKDRSGHHLDVAVKVLRPNMRPAIEKDLSLMRMMAGWVESLSSEAKRLKPREVVAEFDKYLHDELDLVREAAIARRVHDIGAGADHGNRRCADRAGAQGALMGGGIDSQRQPGDNSQSRAAERRGKLFGIGGALRAGVAASDHRQRGIGQ